MPGPRDDSWARVLDEANEADDSAWNPQREGEAPARLVDTAELETQLKQIVGLLPSAHQALRQLLGAKPPRNAAAQLSAARTVLDVALRFWAASQTPAKSAPPAIGPGKPGQVVDIERAARAAAELRRRMQSGSTP